MNYFMKNKCYTLNDQMNAIMKAKVEDFASIKASIKSISESTEQYSLSTKDIITNDSNLVYLQPTSLGSYIKERINDYEG